MEEIQITQQEQPIEETLYSEIELNRITKILRDALNPEHILLFGSLAGGTPHSEITTYDLLIITPEIKFQFCRGLPKYSELFLQHFLSWVLIC